MAVWLRRSSRNIIKHLMSPNYCRNNITTKTTTAVSLLSQEADVVSPVFCVGRRFESTKAAEIRIEPQFYSSEEDEDPDDLLNQGMDFPGGNVTFTSEMSFIGEHSNKRVPCYRLLNDNGEIVSDKICQQVSQDLATRMYHGMMTLQVMDTFLYEAQRQGRISFYMTSHGEEAINIGSAAALSYNDIIFSQYREPGVLLWRGFTLQEFANQCFGNKADTGKGRQMPIHYGSNKHNFFTISSPIATQLPQAVGAAYSVKMDNKKDSCVVAFMGEGCTSEGDFHAGMNFAAVMEVPIVFICRNNGWAISTPVSDQFRSDGVVVKGPAYGIQSIRVDGNDALAVYQVVRAARDIAISEQKPILVEALTYRVGHHSTSDDSTKYRSSDEIKHWKMAKSPISRFRKWMEKNSWWDEERESKVQSTIKQEVIQAIQVAERMEKPPSSELFTDVYDQPTNDLQEQQMSLRETIKRHPKDYPSFTCSL